MAEDTKIELPDDYVEFNTAEMEYSGGSNQAQAEAQEMQQTVQTETSVKDVVMGLAPSLGQMAMMYFMCGRGPVAPVQGQGQAASGMKASNPAVSGMKASNPGGSAVNPDIKQCLNQEFSIN